MISSFDFSSKIYFGFQKNQVENIGFKLSIVNLYRLKNISEYINRFETIFNRKHSVAEYTQADSD